MRHMRWTIALAAVAMGVMACDTMSPRDPGNLVPPTVAEDATLPAIEMNGSRFHLETFGNPANPVIIFLHGGPGGDYRALLRLAERRNGYALTDEYFLVFWDQRSAGLSTRHDRGAVTIDMYVKDLDSLVSRYSPTRPVTLIGESWGGMLATKYINERPSRVAAAVLIEPGPMTGTTMERVQKDVYDFSLGAEWLNDMVWSGQFLSPDDHARMDYARALGMRDGQPRFHQSSTDQAPFWREGAGANRWLMEDAKGGHSKFTYDFTNKLASFTKPVLFLTGALSEVLGASLQQEQVHHYPSATLKVVEGAGHDVFWVKATEVLGHIRTYLDARRAAGGIQ